MELFDKRLIPQNGDTYSLLPFLNGCSDVPYLIGNFRDVAKNINIYLTNGVRNIVIEIPDTGANEFGYIEPVLDCL